MFTYIQALAQMQTKTVPKYELSEITKEVNMNGVKTKLYRIRALEDFGDVKKGDLGGWIENESNLDRFNGECWIYDDAIVCGNSTVSGYVTIKDNAIIMDKVEVKDYVKISGNAIILDNCIITGHAVIKDSVKISGNCHINGCPNISGNVIIKDNVWIKGSECIISDNAKLMDNARINPIPGEWNRSRILTIKDNAVISGDCEIYGRPAIYGNAHIYDYAKVAGNAKVFQHAQVVDNSEVFGYSEIYGEALLEENSSVNNAKIYGNATLTGHARAFNGAEVAGNFLLYSLYPGEVYANGHSRLFNKNDKPVFNEAVNPAYNERNYQEQIRDAQRSAPFYEGRSFLDNYKW